jgi:hypothetical protein
MTAFPVNKLKPTGGSIMALLFENENTNLPRDLYWKVSIDFEPFSFRDEPELVCGAQVEWMKLGLRDWRSLEGRELRSAGPGEGFEASFYAGTHLWSEETRLVFLDRQGSTFLVELDMRVDMTRWLDLTGGATSISTELRLPFEGLMVYFDIADPSTHVAQAALDAALPFIDASAFAVPEVRTNQFGATAWWLSPCDE